MLSYSKLILILISISLIMAFSTLQNMSSLNANDIRGAWMEQKGDQEQVVMFIDNYFTNTVYSKAGRKFISSSGGKYSIKNDKVEIEYEFDTRNKEIIGQVKIYPFKLKENELSIDLDNNKGKYKRIDNGSAPLTGVWHITSRMQNDKLEPIHRTGTRKTIKILSGNRFQWAAIGPGTKEFSGTGRGSYSFTEGK